MIFCYWFFSYVKTSGYDLTGAETENFKAWNKNHIKGQWVEVQYPIYEHSNNDEDDNNSNSGNNQNNYGYWDPTHSE